MLPRVRSELMAELGCVNLAAAHLLPDWGQFSSDLGTKIRLTSTPGISPLTSLTFPGQFFLDMQSGISNGFVGCDVNVQHMYPR